ncbi:MAG: Zn-dependent oxidoreductase, partial [Paenibacillus sp.]|nr:Zn-dependent oxidoreductase [Paenibacillus sp.]
KFYGAVVTGVCSGANAKLVLESGADFALDYAKEDFTRDGRAYDVIFDAVGKRTYGECKRSLTASGIYLSTVPSWSILISILSTSLSKGRKAKFATAGLMQTKANLDFIKELYEAGRLKATIDRTYALEQVPDAHRYVDTGRKKGNVVIVF